MDWLIWGYRKVFWCRRWCQKNLYYETLDEKYVTHRIHTDSLPWFWIGIVYDGKSEPITVTDTVNKNIMHNTRVTPVYLTAITGLDGGIWKYVDSKTLEEKDFPSEGFII